MNLKNIILKAGLCTILLLGLLAFTQHNRAEAGVMGKLYVVNNSNTTIDFYVDGQWCGTLNPGQDAWQRVGAARGDTTRLYAKGANGRQWSAEFKRDVGDGSWPIK